MADMQEYRSTMTRSVWQKLVQAYAFFAKYLADYVSGHKYRCMAEFEQNKQKQK